MKTVVAIAATLLMLAAFAARASSERAKEPVQIGPATAVEKARIDTPVMKVLTVPVAFEAPTAPVKAVEPAPVAVPQARTGGAGMPAPRAIAAQLARELGLSPVQRSSVESILCDRDREIEAYFAEIRARKVFTLEDWSVRMKGIKEGSYRRIEALLDARQASAFFALLERKALKDTIAFRIPDDVANLDEFRD